MAEATLQSFDSRLPMPAVLLHLRSACDFTRMPFDNNEGKKKVSHSGADRLAGRFQAPNQLRKGAARAEQRNVAMQPSVAGYQKGWKETPVISPSIRVPTNQQGSAALPPTPTSAQLRNNQVYPHVAFTPGKSQHVYDPNRMNQTPDNSSGHTTGSPPSATNHSGTNASNGVYPTPRMHPVETPKQPPKQTQGQPAWGWNAHAMPPPAPPAPPPPDGAYPTNLHQGSNQAGGLQGAGAEHEQSEDERLEEMMAWKQRPNAPPAQTGNQEPKQLSNLSREGSQHNRNTRNDAR